MMLEIILGDLSVVAVLFIVPHTIDFSVDIEFFRGIFHLGSECDVTMHICATAHNKMFRRLNKQAIKEAKNQFGDETEPSNSKTVNSHESVGSSTTSERMPSLITMLDDSKENNNSPHYIPSLTTSTENLKQRGATSSPSYSYDDSSEESISSDSDSESSGSSLPLCNMARGVNSL